MNMKKKTVIYQVLPRLFGNTNTTCKRTGTLQENGCGKLNHFTPEALKAIKLLGCTHVWYTGVIEHATQSDFTTYGIEKDNKYVVKGVAGSPYAIKDYYDISPDLAEDVPNRMAEFEALVARTHTAGLKAIIDFVPNHVARVYHSDVKPQGVKDLGEEDNQGVHFLPSNNFYYIPGQELSPQFSLGEGEDRYYEFPAKATGNDRFGAYPNHSDWYETVKLNYGIDYKHGHTKHFDPTPNTWQKMLDILLYWAAKGVDGFRCDMAEMVPVEFWGWVIPHVKEKFPHIIFIAEVYNPHEYRYYIHDGKFDYLYDKVRLYDLLRSIVCNHASATQITQAWQAVDDIADNMLNFLENHDEQRIASDFFAHNPFAAIPALVVSAMMRQNPFMVYAGQELGEPGMDTEGFSGMDGRTSIFDYWCVMSLKRWVNNGKFNSAQLQRDEKKLRTLYKKVLTLCNKEKAISNGSFFDLMYVNLDNPQFDAHHQYAFLRHYDNELLIIIANFSAYEQQNELRIPQHAFDLLHIPTMAEIEAKELITGKSYTKELSPDQPFVTSIPAHSAVIWKLRYK